MQLVGDGRQFPYYHSIITWHVCMLSVVGHLALVIGECVRDRVSLPVFYQWYRSTGTGGVGTYLSIRIATTRQHCLHTRYSILHTKSCQYCAVQCATQPNNHAPPVLLFPVPVSKKNEYSNHRRSDSPLSVARDALMCAAVSPYR